jgi:hypothetical protein
MKLHWGHGIAIFYSVFVGVLVFQVIRSTAYDNSLVSEAYYKDDINYQQHYDKLQNTLSVRDDFKVVADKDAGFVELSFPSYHKDVSGVIYFFNPTSSGKDVEFPIKANAENVQRIPTAALSEGLWKLKVDWTASSKAYYSETAITL